ncbi:SET domain-containing protein [Parathielavia hyrcaniae]|uniref:SET domain-containing protein n=1 Tax=Parathielavia hyrcaniae TaxID=113614 RepID=A0AAN6QC28_9PEZI|nr:SET domain-containing protein [Parathielavia hyrcaniae]
MRISSRLLLFIAQAFVAFSDLGQVRTCGVGSLGLAPGSSVCLADQISLTCQDDDCNSPRQHVWTHTSPCDQGDFADQPICVFADNTFAGGRGISLVTTPQRASFLTTTPAFTEPGRVNGINHDPNTTPKYEMREIPGKGMGLVATAPILRGDLILANTASLMIDYRAFHELSKPRYTALQAAAVSHLPPSHQSLILSLSAHNTTPTDTTSNPSAPEPSSIIAAIAATNSFDIDPHPSDPADEHNSFFVLFPDVARLNHDCRPNAEYRFDYGALAQHVVAARDIYPGEEITLSYIDGLQVRSERVGRLRKNWGFECSCALCGLGGTARGVEADERAELILRVRGELRDWKGRGRGKGKGSRACPEMAELLVSLYETERLWGEVHEAYSLAALEYNAVGEPWLAVKYARLAVEYGIPMLGEEDEDLGELRRLAEDPWSHWSWERMVRGENGGRGGGSKGEGGRADGA